MTILRKIENHLLAYSKNGQFWLLTRTVNEISDKQVLQISQFIVSQTFINLIKNDPGYQESSAEITDTLRIFMARLGSRVNSLTIGEIMPGLANKARFKALATVTDFLTERQKADIGNSWTAGETLLEIARHESLFPADHNDAIASAAGDFMSKFGAQIPQTQAIGKAMNELAHHGNFKTLDAVTGYLKKAQKTDYNLAWMAHEARGSALNLDPPYASDDTTHFAPKAGRIS